MPALPALPTLPMKRLRLVACVTLLTWACSPAEGEESRGASSAGGANGSSGEAGAPSDSECRDSIAAGGSTTSSAAFDCEGALFANRVVDYEFGPGQAIGQDEFPDLIFGAPEGTGCCRGATEGVVSLGNGGWVVLAFDGTLIVDGPGPDFIVFENAFYVGGNEQNVFAELGTVAVSEDGEHWVEFECSATEAPYGHCAGWHPTLAHRDENEIDARDPCVAGGDAFDLADVGLRQARYVRITDRADLNAPLDGVFDLDAVAIVHAACDEP